MATITRTDHDMTLSCVVSATGDETDPVFVASPAHALTTTQMAHLDTAYSWGNHASAGYLTSVPAHNHAATEITSGTIGTARLGSGTADATTHLRGDQTWATSREALTADRTYYVSTSGNDSNTGLAVGAPFLTLQKAVDVVCGTLDLGAYQVTIQLADGTYTAGATLKSYVGVLAPIIQGNSGTPANVVVSTTSADAFVNESGMPYVIKNLKTATTTSGSCIRATGGSGIDLYNINFGACADYHILAEIKSKIECKSNYAISGGAKRHYNASILSTIKAASITVTISGTPAFSEFFAGAFLNSSNSLTGITFSGSATGTRYSVGLNSTIYTGSGGATYFPGNATGSTATGGQYA